MDERADEENKEEEEEEEEERRSVEEEDLEEALREAAPPSAARRTAAASGQQPVLSVPEAVDDFLRNFLRRAGLHRTLDVFEAEWYGSAQKLLTGPLGTAFIPDALTHGRLLRGELEAVLRETGRLRRDVLQAAGGLARMQRERDFHRLQHRRVAEEKNRLIGDFHRLKEHLRAYEPALRQLEDKRRAALRRKMLIGLEKDRVQNATGRTEEKAHIRREAGIKRSTGADPSPDKRHPKDSEFPVSRPVDPQGASQTWRSPSSFSPSFSFRAHQLPVSCIQLHPRGGILASASDDRSWRLWELLPGGEKVGQMLLTGEGHSDWLSGCSFHPDGDKLATTSGDSTVRLWDFSLGGCVAVLPGHGGPTWGCSFHSCGDFLASCSADRTAKLWDLSSRRCRLTLRRHTASVNSVCFLPSSSRLLTCSADRTLAVWDARLGVCAASFHGHRHPCNHAAFSPAGDAVASCDARGVVHLWDARNPALPTATVDAGPLAANQLAFSPSGKRLAVAGADGLVRLVEADCGAASSLAGHGDAVQSVAFDHQGATVVSAGSDGVIHVWAGNS